MRTVLSTSRRPVHGKAISIQKDGESDNPGPSRCAADCAFYDVQRSDAISPVRDLWHESLEFVESLHALYPELKPTQQPSESATPAKTAVTSFQKLA